MFIQKFKNKIKNRKLNFLILLIILTVVIHSIPKKIFTILNTSFIERKTSIAYDYCGKSSTGYIFDLQNRINFSNPPKIINNGKNPNQYWTFYTNKKFDDKYVFVLSSYKNKEILEDLLDKYKIIHNHKDDCLLLEKK